MIIYKTDRLDALTIIWTLIRISSEYTLDECGLAGGGGDGDATGRGGVPRAIGVLKSHAFTVKRQKSSSIRAGFEWMRSTMTDGRGREIVGGTKNTQKQKAIYSSNDTHLHVVMLSV